MSVGVMKDYKLKQRDLRASHTMTCSAPEFVRNRNNSRPFAQTFMSFTERLRDDAKETWRAVVEHPFTGMMISYRGMRASPHLSEISLSDTFSSSDT